MKYLFLFISLIGINIVLAQHVCGTHEPTVSELNYIINHVSQQAILKNGATTCIPIQAHVVRESNGTGGVSLDDMHQGIASLNEYYYPAGIEFYFCGTGPNFIDNSNFYDFQTSEENALAAAAGENNNAINMYFVDGIDYTGGPSFTAGYAYTPFNNIQSTRIVMRNGSVADGSTLVHEMGHHYSLLHTFRGTSNGNTHPDAEHVTRLAPNANCTSDGDLLCDTPADPGYTGTNVNASCNYIGTNTDAFGDLYVPDITNVMSYFPQQCQNPPILTPEQITRIQQGLVTRQGHSQYTMDCPSTNVADPSGLTATLSGSSVVLNWTDNSNNEFGFFIERSATSATSGFEAYSGFGVAANTTTFADNSGLIPGNTYYYRVKASNDGCNDYSNVDSVTATYCAGNGNVCDEFVARVQLNTIDNSSACSAGGYHDYTSISTSLTVGTNYTATITNGMGYNGDQCGVWIDWNQNDIFDASEALTVTGGNTVFTANFTVPAAAVIGNTTLRTRVHFNNEVTDPCGTANFGEVEDYSINVVSGVSCDITAISAGTQSACNPGTNTYSQNVTVTYSNAPTGTLNVNGQTFTVGTSPQTVTLSNLTANGNAVNVTAFFTSDTSCNFTQSNTFTAPSSCAPPPSCAITGLSAGTQGSCDPGTNTYSQDVIVSYVGAPSTGMLSVNNQSFTIATSPQTVNLSGLIANGNTVDVLALFTEAGIVDDFETGTVEGWVMGTNAPTQPANIISGGPFGTTDNYLQAVSTGTGGAGGKMVFFNQTQWTGDFTTNGWTEVKFYAKNFGTTPLELRVALEGVGGRWCTSLAYTIPAGSDWQEFIIPIAAGDLTYVGAGTNNVNATLSNVFTTRILSNTSPSWQGQVVAGDLGIDLIRTNSCELASNSLFTAPANCTPTPTCNITAISSGTQSACNPGTNTYSQDVVVTYSNAPTGTLNVNGQTFTVGASPQMLTLTGLIADGNSVNVTAFFTNDTSCNFTQNNAFTAPASCAPVPCTITAISTGAQTACDPGTNTYTQEVTVTYSNPPSAGMLNLNGNSFAIGTSPQTVTLMGLTADGNSVDLTALFTNATTCTFTENNAFTAPANCSATPCMITGITAGTQTACDPGTNNYSQEVTITYVNAPGAITISVNGQIFPVGASPQTVTLTNLPSDGNGVNVTAFFTSDTSCNFTENLAFTAPTPCTMASCSVDGITAGNQSTCNPSNNTYSQTLTLTYTNPSAGFIDVNGQTFPVTTSPQTVTLTNLPANGSSVDVTAGFTGGMFCQSTIPNVFTAPNNCTPAVLVDSLVVIMVPDGAGSLLIENDIVTSTPFIGVYPTDSLINISATPNGSTSFDFWELNNLGFQDFSPNTTFTFTNQDTLFAYFNGAVGISDLSSYFSSFRLYPTVFENHVNLDFELKETVNLRVDLFGLDGVLLAHLFDNKVFAGFQHKKRLAVNVSTGLYFIRVQTDQETHIFRLIKK